MRKVQEVIESVCRIPSEFHQRGDVSVVRLVEESGYRIHRVAIAVDDLERYLRARPELVQDWDVYSASNRKGSGWYFDRAARSVGCYRDNRRQHEQVFDDAAQACATFIKREIDSIIDHTA